MYEITLILLPALLFFLYKLLRADAIFIPLPRRTIEQMLELTKIKKGDLLYDLGCGDGRVLILATKKYGIRAVGIEKNSFLFWLCKRNIRKNKLENKIKLIKKDFFREDLGKANVVVVYLSQRTNDKLKPKLEKELKKRTRIVSADHIFKGWKEIKRIKTGHFYTHLYKI
jgi:predicted RNA methylase